MGNKKEDRRKPFIGEDGFGHAILLDGEDIIFDKSMVSKVNMTTWRRDRSALIVAQMKGKTYLFRKILFPSLSKVKFINGDKRDYRESNVIEGKRKCWVDGNICYIESKFGELIFCDSFQFERVRKYRWSLNGSGYPITTINGKRMFLHRYVFEGKYDRHIDHKNRNPLDNRACNLRAANDRQNVANRGKPCTNTPGYKGVYWDFDNKKWVSSIRYCNKTFYLGSFLDPIKAAMTYDKKAIEFFGEFSCLNFPEELVEVEDLGF